MKNLGFLLIFVSLNKIKEYSVNYLTEVNRRVTLDTFVKVKGYYRGKKRSRGKIYEGVNVRGQSCI